MPSVARRASDGTNRRAVVEAKILKATEQLLVGGASFTELGVQRLAAEAGIPRSTFYLHFRDKTELLLRLIDTLADGAFDLICSASPADGGEGMIAAMVQCVRYYRERRHLLAAVLGVSAYDADARKFRDGQLQRFIDKAEVWLCGEQEAGRTPLDLDATTAARVFVWGGYQAVAG